MILPSWRQTEYGFYSKVGVYRLYLQNDTRVWQLEIWESERTHLNGKKLLEHTFLVSDPKCLQVISYDCLKSLLEELR